MHYSKYLFIVTATACIVLPAVFQLIYTNGKP